MAVGVESVGGDVLLCVGEASGFAAAGCCVGPGEGAEGREDEPDGGVGDGLGAGGAGVAVDHAFFGQGLRVDPVEAGAGGGIDFAGGGEEVAVICVRIWIRSGRSDTLREIGRRRQTLVQSSKDSFRRQCSRKGGISQQSRRISCLSTPA